MGTYYNPKIEQELLEFKEEIHEKFYKSEINRVYRFPRPLLRDYYSSDEENEGPLRSNRQQMFHF